MVIAIVRRREELIGLLSEGPKENGRARCLLPPLLLLSALRDIDGL